MFQTRQRDILHITKVVVFVCDYVNFITTQSGLWAADLSNVFQTLGNLSLVLDMICSPEEPAW